MVYITDEQKKAIGLSFIMDALLADSPYGAEKIKAITFFKTNEKAALLETFYNTQQVFDHMPSQDEILGQVRRFLMRFKNIRKALRKCEQSYCHEVELFEIKHFLLTLLKLEVDFNAFNKVVKLKNIGFINMEAALNVLDPDKKRIAPFSINDQHSSEIWKIRKEKARIESLMHNEQGDERREKLKIERTKVVAQEEAEENKIKKELSNQLRVFMPQFMENMENIGKLDLIIQKALIAREYGGICPTVTEDAQVVLENMFNPEISVMLERKAKTFTPISIAIDQGTTILTGANMGGKSVAIKTTVLNIMLCQLGFFVFAEKVEMPLFDGVCLISEDLQDMSQGLSTFGAEIMRFNDIVQQEKTDFLFIALDEFARGTNPEEGAIIVKAVARHLAVQKSLSIMSTHYDNIVEKGFNHYQVAGLSGLDFDHIRQKLSVSNKNGVDLIAEHMDYRLVKVDGLKAPPRDALNICKLLSLDADVLKEIEMLYQ